MKKVILIISFLCGFIAANAQYTYIAQRYDWLAGLFRALGLPAGDSAQFQTSQRQRAGSVYYDSTETVGSPKGLYIWDGSVWGLIGSGSTYTGSEGITLSGSDFRLGGPISAPTHITTERALISDSNVILHHRSKYDGTNIPVGGENVSFAYASYAPYQFISYDTAYTNKTATTYDIYPQSNTFFSRRIHFPVGGGKSLYGLYGNKSEILYTAYDSAVIRNDGGDYSGAQINQFKIRNIPGYTGRTVFKMYHGAGDDIINTPSRNIDGSFATLSNIYIENDNAANPIRVRGRIFGHMSYLVMGFVAADTLDEWVAYGAGTFMGAPGKVTRIKFFAPTIGTSLSHQDSVYLIYDRDSPGNGYKSIHKGSMLLGSHIYTTSPYKLDVQGAVRFYDSLRVKTSQITDTTGYNIVLQRRLDSVLVSMPAPTLAAIIGAGAATPTLQQVLDAGSTLSSTETIAISGNVLGISGTSNNITFNDALGAIRVTNSSSSGLSIASTNAGTSNFFTRSASSDAFPVASFKNTSSGTNTAARLLSLGRATTGTPGDGLAGEIFFSLETAGVGASEDVEAGRLRYKFSTVDHPTRTSEIDIDGVDNGTTEVFMNIQKDLVRINNNADTLATKAYARSVGGSGGSPQNLSWDAGNHEVDIDGGGTSAVIPLATSSANGLATPNQVIGTIGTTADGMGSVVTTGSKGFITIPYDATITNWYVACNASGSIQFDIKRSGTSIVGGGGNKPLVSSAQNGNAAVSGWTSTAVTAGDILEWNVDSATTVVNCSCTLKVIK